ncbi:bifunctional phosphopantothenoylcysteine decarboxylase/phosphopantothenate--cysteine ligase CoaBC [Deminuibacter soli]|uniref:Coenzyme A biosynthesis bifunctional protein CoaBC n=1 Tax=Deminuibacter soli TaxID=2291815 RepID=A0A3E1NE44_9BACT|nr:bifunctional phosphopantothenoylcysteine decarboxylase/phosphopantothenate--cysteine ligase CoaBC [Deminuibacter soli]RFM26048.1 bifunctional phosphopantothenoylcysteine decarboxylase/phosphopantothenate--cysteine ligase CoaBC [Deminuibacter soli]
MLKGKKILLGITGSIAAYKSILLVRELVKAGAEVKTVLTPAAADFVSPLVLATLSKNKVLVNLADEATWANHVELGRWADVMVIAPLSCNTLAKMAHGQCDNLLLAVYLSATCPVVVAPAMDEDMWHHPATRQNLQQLASFGNKVIPVGKGELASGLFGEGRMAEPEAIIRFLEAQVFRQLALAGKTALVTAGPTYEPIDPVRFIGNHSSGKMGFALANALYLQGAAVQLVSGPTALQPAYEGIELIRVQTAQQMYEACISAFPAAAIAVMSAAVADYRPVEAAPEKIKKTGSGMELQLVKTPDILQSLGSLKQPHQFVAGFALETTNETEHAMQKLRNKNADMIVLNSLRNKEAGFGVDTNAITIFDKDGGTTTHGVMPKDAVAAVIVEHIIQKLYAPKV